jgi:Tfp pilus assembly protein PilN
MNLRLDLILESERRSGSPVSLKSVGRIAAVVIPVVVVLLLSSAMVTLMRLKAELDELEAAWRDLGPRKEKAAALSTEFQKNRQTIQELNGWKSSHMDCHVRLANLMAAVPPTIQLTNLKLDQSLQSLDNSSVARVFSLALEGRAVGEGSEKNVEAFKQTLAERPVFTNVIGEVKVGQFGADLSKGAEKFDRVFRIECKFRPRKFE